MISNIFRLHLRSNYDYTCYAMLCSSMVERLLQLKINTYFSCREFLQYVTQIKFY
jgi:hypothetical protein